MKKILFIDTNTTPFNEAFPVYPVGLDYLQGSLGEESGVEARILDLTRMGGPLTSPDFTLRKKRSLELIKEAVSREHWDIIGLSLRNIDSTYPAGSGDPCLHYYLPDLMDYIRAAADSAGKNSFILLGGTAFSMMPEVFMEGQDENCFGLIGPAEFAFPSLVHGLLQGEAVPGITKGNAHGIGMLHNRELIKEYFRLPVGDSTFGIRTRVGCGQRCGYCPYPLVSGPEQVLKEPEQVLAEIDLLREIHHETGSSTPLRFMFADDIFNRPLDHAKTILRAMLEYNLIPDSWHAYLDPKNVDEEFAGLILESNGWCRGIEGQTGRETGKRIFNFLLDIESGSSKILKKIGKPYTVEDIHRSVHQFRKVAGRFMKRPDVSSVRVGFHVLLGYPGEDENTVRETCELINELEPSYITVQVGVRIYPRTPLAEETRGVLWNRDEDLIKPRFSDMDTSRVMAWLKRYLHDRYTQFRQSGNMILIDI